MTDPIKAALARTESCPPLERLARESRNPEMERHLGACLHCRTELDLLRQFEAAEARPDEAADVEWIAARLRGEVSHIAVAPPRESLWDQVREWLAGALAPASHRALAAAAAVLLVVAGALYFRQAETPARYPATEAPVWRSAGLTALSPSGELASAPAGLKWDAAPNAALYHVRLMEVDRTVIWSTETAQTSAVFPPEIRAQVRPGRAFYWSVAADNAAGQTIASSDLQSFHIAVTRP